jgi:hypothetical protein
VKEKKERKAPEQGEQPELDEPQLQESSEIPAKNNSLNIKLKNIDDKTK